MDEAPERPAVVALFDSPQERAALNGILVPAGCAVHCAATVDDVAVAISQNAVGVIVCENQSPDGRLGGMFSLNCKTCFIRQRSSLPTASQTRPCGPKSSILAPTTSSSSPWIPPRWDELSEWRGPPGNQGRSGAGAC